jgi:UDP-N-acetylenolpyruvoylglucosamine reductase
MNAGVRELSTWDLVEAVEGITWSGERTRLDRAAVRPTYRSGNLPPDLIVTIVECRVRGGNAEEIHSKAREHSSTRR